MFLGHKVLVQQYYFSHVLSDGLGLDASKMGGFFHCPGPNKPPRGGGGG